MMLVGLIGMPLSLWLFTPDRTPAPPARETVTVAQDAAPVVNTTTPADEFTGPQQPPEQTPVLVQDELAAPPTPTSPPAPDPALTETSLADTAMPSVELPPTATRYIAIIIDDIGYVDILGARAVALPDDVTYAVLPHTPFGAALAETAHGNGKEVMLHAPMSNLANMALGPGGLTPTQSKEEFIATLVAAMAAVPHLKGINNHMGSELTTRDEQMRWVMETLKGQNLYFVDSYTTANSVAGRIAQEADIPTLTRNVFLDNVQTHEDIDREFQRLLQVASEKGFATGIGHPYEATLEYLEKAIPTLSQLNIELIPVSQMIKLQQDATDAL